MWRYASFFVGGAILSSNIFMSPYASFLVGGAMNSGPTGSVMHSERMASMSRMALSSSDQPMTSLAGSS